jgi:hypothetical protein
VDVLPSPPDSWAPLLIVGTVVIVLSGFAVGCSDDPVLGPDDGAPDDSGGSYSTIKRLAPADSTQPPGALEPSASPNPERF